jgi:2-oxoglutarate ferredoxin oxidoreductase subunit gamma
VKAATIGEDPLAEQAFEDETVQIRIAGLGGQGVVMASLLLGRAAVLLGGKQAVCTQTHGPEARGGASRADVILSDEPIDYPYVTHPDVLVVLFQEAYDRFRPGLKSGGVLIFDSGLVHPRSDDLLAIGLPATEIARELGAKTAANVVMLGYLVGRTGVIGREAAEETIRATVREQALELDLRAFEAGFSRARSDLDR